MNNLNYYNDNAGVFPYNFILKYTSTNKIQTVVKLKGVSIANEPNLYCRELKTLKLYDESNN